jgi:DNA-binding CsgD family transcriptional regulator
MILTEAKDRFAPKPSLELLSPLIRDISQAPGLSALEQAVQSAVEALGFRYFVFVSGLSRVPDEPFRPVMATLPKGVCETLLEKQLYRANPVLAHIRATGEGITVDFSALPDSPVIMQVRAMMSPLGVVGAGVVPVISATEDITVLAAYAQHGVPCPDVLEPLAMVGTALSIRMLTLHCKDQSEPLTDAQREILKWAAAGKSSGDIATIIGLSRRGCEYHLGEIYRKLGVSSRSQAVAAYARGLA